MFIVVFNYSETFTKTILSSLYVIFHDKALSVIPKDNPFLLKYFSTKLT